MGEHVNLVRSDTSRTFLEEAGPAMLYCQDPKHKMQGGHISDGAYEEFLRNAVVVCADVVFVNKERQVIYLATRRNLPMRGLWWIGGRVRAGETSREAICRNVLRETKLSIAPDRFNPIDWMLRYQWSERQQEPQNAGTDSLCFMFWAELTERELQIASNNLHPEEYDSGLGLTPWGRKALELPQSGVHPVILDVYNTIFPQLSAWQRFRCWLADLIAG